MKKITFLMVAALVAFTAYGQAPTDFLDLGEIGEEGEYVFDTVGSVHTDASSSTGNVDTELGLWDESGTLVDSNDDTTGLFSKITATLVPGVYFLGSSEFNSLFEDGFINSGTGFEDGDVADMVLNINGALAGTVEDVTNAFEQGTAFLEL
jgi:hypothetical protein